MPLEYEAKIIKYEVAIRNEFSSMTTEVEEQNKEKIINRNAYRNSKIMATKFIR